MNQLKQSQNISRNLNDNEVKLVNWLLLNGENNNESYLEQLSDAIVTFFCACGCVCIDLSIKGQLRASERS